MTVNLGSIVLGTGEAPFGVQVLIRRCRDVNCNMCACSTDFEKTFDKTWPALTNPQKIGNR